MFKIGEFSRLTQISKRMLRYYDETNLLKPHRKDPTGYRLYELSQIPEINKIKTLRDLGFLIEEIRELVTLDDEAFSNYLTKQETEIEQTILSNQEKLSQLRHLKTSFQTKTANMSYEVQIKTVPAYRIVSLRKTIDTYFTEGILWKSFFDKLSAAQIPLSPTNERFTIYHDSEEYLEREIDVELAIVIPKTIEHAEGLMIRELAAEPEMASILVYGPFENIDGVYHSLAQWLNDHPHYRIHGKSRQLPINGPWNCQSSADYLTELQIPVKKTSD